MGQGRSTSLRRAIAGALAVGILAGCGENVGDADRLEDAIDATTALAGRFSYAEDTSEGSVTVDGVVEDDFRFKAALGIDGQVVLEQVVSDDALAVRLLAPDALDELLDPLAVDVVEVDADGDGVSTLDALGARRWVLDVGGAPPSVVSAESLTDVGNDPVLDARTVLGYVRGVIQNDAVVRYKEDATQPAFPGDEDVFAQPEDGSGVTRFDVPTFDLPSVSSSTSGSRPVFPGPLNFRKMVIYVENGQVVRVEERTEIVGDKVDEVADYLYDVLRTTNSAELADQFRASFEATPPAEVQAFLFGGLNTIRELAGEDPIRPRRMVFELDTGSESVAVALPADTINGDLAVLRNLGRKPAEVRDAQAELDEAASDPSADPAAAAGAVGGAEVGDGVTSTTQAP